MADEEFLEEFLINFPKKRRLPIRETNISARNTDQKTRLCNRRRFRAFFMLVANLWANPPVDRRVWALPRSDEWFQMADTILSEEQWYSNFRVSKETFQYILSEVEEQIVRQDTKLRKAIPARKKLAITLYFIGSTAEYRTIVNLFGVSTAFVCLCIKEVAITVVGKMKASFLTVPKGDDLSDISIS